jgi:hypothetical protein
MSTDTQRRPNADDEGISERRRQMLRAAATAAPLVATLPSGAALANASAFQCIAADKTATDAGEFNFVYSVNGTTLVTVPASVQTGEKDVNVSDSVNTPPGNGQGATRSQSWRSGLSLSMRVPNGNGSEARGSVPAVLKPVTVYRIGEGTTANPYKYFEYLNGSADLPLSVSDSNPEEGPPYYGFTDTGWDEVEVVRVYDIGSPPYTFADEDCGAEPCVLLAQGPTSGTNLTALNDSCMTSIVQHDVG